MARTLADIYRRAAAQVHEILSGANPSGYTPSSSQQVRAGDQFQDGEGVGADRAAVSACPCRWGDRIGTRLTVSFVALHESGTFLPSPARLLTASLNNRHNGRRQSLRRWSSRRFGGGHGFLEHRCGSHGSYGDPPARGVRATAHIPHICSQEMPASLAAQTL